MKNICLKLLLFFPMLYWAQIPIIETPDKKGGFENNNKVILHKLNIETKITAGISTNVITMVFKNNSNRLMEGRLTFPLPEGVNVSGYALDINGKLRNAVPVEKEKAKEVFETIQKRNVDPGILEKVEGNNFRTRIYPINANGGERTVQISYNYELKKQGSNYQYFLPLNYSAQIPEFTIKTSVFQNTVSPQLEEKPDGSFNFVKNGNVWVAETHQLNYKPTQNLKINFPQTEGTQNVLIQRASDNSSYFLANLGIDPKEKAKKLPNKLAIIWDNSLSGSKRDHTKEFTLLEEYFKVNKNLSVKIYFLNNTFDEGKNLKINDGNWSELKSYLSQVTYDGGTDFGQLKSVKEDEVLFFTDGLSSFGDLKMAINRPVYTISSSGNANFNQLKFISNKTGGEFLNLSENDAKKEVRKLLYQALKFIGIENNSSLTEVYPSLSQTISQDFVLTGILNGNQATIKVLFGYENEVTEAKAISLDVNRQSVKDWEISQFWAQKKLNELEMFEKENKNQIKNISRQFGLVSNNMSLMVLENVQDYVRYEINPPSELREEYNQIVKNNQAQKDARVNDLMAKAEIMTGNLKKWWDTDFEKKPKYYPTPRRSKDTARVMDIEEVVVTAYGIKRSESSVAYASSTVVSSPVPTPSAQANVVQALEGRAQGISIRGAGSVQGDSKSKEIAETIIQKGKITIVDVKSDAAYMKFFGSAKNSEEIYQTYLEHRKDYAETPQYYFDVAQLFFKIDDKKTGLKVLSSIADLDLENEELYKLLAYKLKQAEVYDKELWISKKVLEWLPFDPQSYRDYALALEDNKDYQGALDNLYKILNQSYTREMANRDHGIEETIIMEINELISNHRNELDIKNINPKIIADLPVNIRVVINWNKDNTDIDLWVTDPNNERCMYSHKSTEIGGRLSDDFTGGFGPEQFLLKKAIKGKYKIETNFYNENQVSIAGATAIMAEVFINYASGKQERKIVVFQNKSEADTGNRDGVLIGEFEF
ncbi:VIT domain-containing protein [Chryseobacterium limigenitum]|uniref:Vault protein inter-alpha-trypsin domain-containing protein n=1 Tax=Chryseobacterium limigenitum TaxID=1612149 RepID=A0A1K2IY25_9FLAO|nr:VIT domain-containing protein [Chryseobacterium limigenitum]SFZ96691.1 Vault protein inter-alpha-trypsin domain-containing protein [Chryseobacterium limigenitum]